MIHFRRMEVQIKYIAVCFLFSQELSYANGTNSSTSFKTMVTDKPCATKISEALLAVKKMKSNIRKIYLIGRNISCVPADTFADKKQLQVLLLRHNPLNIPSDRPWIRHPTLSFLDIANCNLGPLSPVVFKNLPGLKYVNMAGNTGCFETHKGIAHIKINCVTNPSHQIQKSMEKPCATKISEALLVVEKMNPDVGQINLIGKNISCIPVDTFVEKKQLRAILLGDNPLNISPDQPWIRHPTLSFLDITDCNLGPLSPDVFKNLPGIKVVNMAGNFGCFETQKGNPNITVKCDRN